MQRSKIKILEMIPDNAESQYTTSMSPAELKFVRKKLIPFSTSCYQVKKIIRKYNQMDRSFFKIGKKAFFGVFKNTKELW